MTQKAVKPKLTECSVQISATDINRDNLPVVNDLRVVLVPETLRSHERHGGRSLHYVEFIMFPALCW